MTKPPSTKEEFELDATGVPKPCRGLDGVFCGLPRKKKQSYCSLHQAEYQRRRYARIQREAGRTYTEREHTRTTNVLICSACGNPKPEGLLVLHGLTMPPICDTCKTFFDTLRTEFGIPHAVRVAAFMLKHEEQIMKDLADADEQFEKWYDEQIDKYLARVEWPEGREDCKEHWRDHFTKEYAKLQEKSV